MEIERSIVGVYVVTCLETSFRYVGSSGKCVGNRISYHRAALKKGYHYNRNMQKDYDLYGWDAFDVKIFPSSADARLNEEQKKIDYWKARGLCYNLHPNAVSAVGHILPEDPKRGLRAKERCTPEWRAAVSERVKAQHAAKKFGRATWSEEAATTQAAKMIGKPSAMKGRHHTEEARAKISARHKGVSKSAEHVAKLSGVNNHNYGKPSPRRGTTVSEVSRERIRQAALAREAAKKLNRKGV